jgi:hypothetical protein
MSEKTTCPRRVNELGPWEHKEGLDTWREDGTCSFCGSLHPDKFIQAVKDGAGVVPTDKNYKAYVNPGHRKVYFQHMDADQKQELVRLINDKKVNFAYPGYFYVLPFFVEVVKRA